MPPLRKESLVNILDEIVADTRKRLNDLPRDLASLRRAAAEQCAGAEPHRFDHALRGGVAPRVIAEIKSASPSAGTIVANPDVAAIASEYRDGGAAALSVVTEPHFFRGKYEWLRKAKNAAELPVIMKDFIVDARLLYHGVAHGADAVLLLASILEPLQIREFIFMLDELGCDALVEVHDKRELERALQGGARIIGVNNRDLTDFSVSLETSERLSTRMPSTMLRVAESGIRTHADIQRLERAGFRAFLVGESLLRQLDRTGALRSLRGAA